MAGDELTWEQEERYERQLALESWGHVAQLRVGDTAALVVGVGALGSAAATYLAAAGVGRLGLVDDAQVQPASLASESLHYTPDLDVPKAASAAAKLGFLNPEVVVETYPAFVDASNAGAIALGHDVVLDCTNAADSRLALADACAAAGLPLLAAGTGGLAGFVLVVANEGACLRCALGEDGGRGEEEEGLLGAVAGMLGSAQALEALKLLSGLGEPPAGVMRLDAERHAWRTESVAPRPGCVRCGPGRTAASL